MKLVGRRAFVGGAGLAAVGLAGAEAASLHGTFDHRRRAGGASAYADAVARIDRDALLAAGAVVHVGHSTHLLSVGGGRFLTDPWFFDPAFGALSHERGPAAPPEVVGRLDAILVSHDHPDHLDLQAVDRLDKGALFFAPTTDVAARVRARGFGKVVVLAPWEHAEVAGARVTAVPAQHDVYEIGYVVEGGGRVVYFAGDTRLFDGVNAIAERFRPSLAILPVDGTRIAGSALAVMTPSDAALAARILRSRMVMPSHAEAYFSDPLAGHLLASTIASAASLFLEAVRRSLPGTAPVAPQPGELVEVPA